MIMILKISCNSPHHMPHTKFKRFTKFQFHLIEMIVDTQSSLPWVNSSETKWSEMCSHGNDQHLLIIFHQKIFDTFRLLPYSCLHSCHTDDLRKRPIKPLKCVLSEQGAARREKGLFIASLRIRKSHNFFLKGWTIFQKNILSMQHETTTRTLNVLQI